MSNNGQVIPKALKLTPTEVHELKGSLTRITVYDLWRLIVLPGYRNLPNDSRADHSCLSPLRDENKESFSIFNEGRRWKDHGDNTNEFNHGDCVDFLMRSTGMDRVVASRIIIAIDSINEASENGDHPSNNGHNPFTDPLKATNRATWPQLEIPTTEETQKLAALRTLSPAGIKAAVNKGFLRCANSSEGRVWVITDNTRYLAQIRRFDGKTLAGGAKAKSLKGSIGSWPIGLKEAAKFPAIALVEGGADLLAAIDLIIATGTETAISPVAMLGSSMRIAETMLPLFAEKRVRIFAHIDQAGQTAARQWADQLQSINVEVTGYSFAGLSSSNKPVGDLNDFISSISENPTAEEINLLSEAFSIEGL
jgi:hypothetical protein